MMRSTAVAWTSGVCLALMLVSPLAAQEMRTLHVSRTASDTSTMHVDIQYGIGELTVQPAAGPVLYDARLTYPADRSTPLAHFDPASRTLALGIKDRQFDGPGKDSGSTLQVQLARGVPLDLSFKVGAAAATLNLGGLAVRQLMLKGGATEATIRFDSPNAIRMESLDLKVGAAELQVHGLANARADRIFVEGAAGDVELWFDGSWTHDVTLESKIYFGDMKIHVPPNVQVVSTAKAMLGDVSDAGANSAKPAVDDNDDSDDSDSSDMSDMSDMSDSMARKMAPKLARVHPMPHPMPHVVPATGATGGPAAYTLRVTGSATIGSLEILHDAPPGAPSN